MSNDKKKVETNEEFWRKWWDSQTRNMLSNYELDRMTSVRNNEMEQFSERELLDFVSPQETDIIFDAGCGTGNDLRIVSPRIKAIVGMDQSGGMISRCREKIVEENIDNAHLMIGSVSNIALKGNLFDKIICMSVLHYLNDEECDAALKELARIAKNEAIIIFHVKNLFSIYLSTLYLAKKIKSLFKTNSKTEYYRTYRWYESKFSDLGIQILDYNSVNKFNIDILSKYLFYKLQNLEIKCYKNRILRHYGSDYKIKAKVVKH